MSFLAFSPGKVGALPTYLNYLFLRFPGTLGPEESWSLECVDTYDRRWTNQGRIWVRLDGVLTLVQPPSLLAFGTDAGAFGLQAPVTVVKLVAKVRRVVWEAGKGKIEGQVVTVGTQRFLIVESSDPLVVALAAALEADGLTPVEGDQGWWVKDKAGGFISLAPQSALPSAPAADFLLAHLRDGLRLARLYEKGTRDDVDTECLHQYRVHLRRVRSLTSEGLLWQLVPEWVRLKNLLRTLQQKTNELRDLDVLLLEFPDLQAALPWDEGLKLEGWKQTLARRRLAEFRRVRAWLKSEDYTAILAEVERLFDDLGRFGEPWTMAEWSTAVCARSAKGLKKCLVALGQAPADEALHELRIRAKRLRYVLDTLGFLGPPGLVKPLIGRLKQSQEGLGRFQDRSILLGRLKAELQNVRQDHSVADPVALGMLAGVLVANHGAQKARALEDAHRLGSRPFLKALGKLVSAGPPYGT